MLESLLIRFLLKIFNFVFDVALIKKKYEDLRESHQKNFQ